MRLFEELLPASNGGSGGKFGKPGFRNDDSGKNRTDGKDFEGSGAIGQRRCLSSNSIDGSGDHNRRKGAC